MFKVWLLILEPFCNTRADLEWLKCHYVRIFWAIIFVFHAIHNNHHLMNATSSCHLFQVHHVELHFEYHCYSGNQKLGSIIGQTSIYGHLKAFKCLYDWGNIVQFCWQIPALPMLRLISSRSSGRFRVRIRVPSSVVRLVLKLIFQSFTLGI